MDRIFLAIMVSAVLLLIVASDLLVNGPSRQDQTAQMANIQPVAARLIREVRRCALWPNDEFERSSGTFQPDSDF